MSEIITVQEMKDFCPDCAAMMVEAGLDHVTIAELQEIVSAARGEIEIPELLPDHDTEVIAKELAEADVAEAKIAGAPKEVNKKYEQCMKRYNDKGYCARVAWSIFCKYVDPSYEGCKKGRYLSGPPYATPVSK